MRATPDEQRVGRLRVAVSLGPIARMFAAAKWSDPDNAGGGAIFAGSEAAVAQNVVREPDPAGPPPGLFNLDVRIHDVNSGHPVPYLDVRADLSRNGDAVPTGFEMVPVARPTKGAAGLHYGNNGAPMSQFVPSGGRLHVSYHAEMAPIHGAWMAGELRRHGYGISPDGMLPVFYRMQDEGLLRPDRQIVDGRVRRVYALTRHGIWALERSEFTLGLGEMKIDP